MKVPEVAVTLECLNEPSRLKGMETNKGNPLVRSRTTWSGLNEPSRLKGMETQI